MAKKSKSSGSRPKRGLKTWEIVVIAVVVAFAGWFGWSSWNAGQNEDEFKKLATAGTPGLAAVTEMPGRGTGHFSPGQSGGYVERFPTSGAHNPNWINPGVYDLPQRPDMLVHSLEHGNIVVYYDKPGMDAMRMLSAWAALYADPWSGVVVTPAPGLGEEVVLTAWKRMLRQQPFEAATAAAFIDRFRGRGPENPVR